MRLRAHFCDLGPQFSVHDNVSPTSSLTPPNKKQTTLCRFLSHSNSRFSFEQAKKLTATATAVSPLLSPPRSNSMETNASFQPNANAHPNESVELDLSNSASIAFVCASAFLCLLLVLAYCHCYCSESGTEVCRVLRKRKPTSPLPLPVVFYSKATEELTRGCVICLSEFEDKEAIKVIPGCGHVFHPQCIDRWLVARRSCPVCRCSKIFGSGDNKESEPEEVEVEQGAAGMRSEEQVIRIERSRSWCYRVDGEEERRGMRRTCSF